jgi:hypothetical protein
VVGDLSFTARRGLRRVPGGLVALSVPIILAAVALGVDFDAAGGEQGLATAVLGTILFLMAAPTTWIFAIDFIEAGRVTVVLIGLITSLPLWYLAGVRLAVASEHWGQFLLRYATLCVLVAVGTVGIIEVFGSLS